MASLLVIQDRDMWMVHASVSDCTSYSEKDFKPVWLPCFVLVPGSCVVGSYGKVFTLVTQT